MSCGLPKFTSLREVKIILCPTYWALKVVNITYIWFVCQTHHFVQFFCAKEISSKNPSVFYSLGKNAFEKLPRFDRLYFLVFNGNNLGRKSKRKKEWDDRYKRPSHLYISKQLFGPTIMIYPKLLSRRSMLTETSRQRIIGEAGSKNPLWYLRFCFARIKGCRAPAQ